MHINLETTEQHAIQSYEDGKIQINSIIYENSLIVSSKEIITDLTIRHIQNMEDNYLQLLLTLKPELIIIGHTDLGKFPPLLILSRLSQQQIGIECMNTGAACRTYNVLLSEHRSVVAGFII